MADEPFITRKDLEDVTQRVAIQNSKDIAKPLIDQQKNNDLKELERSIEQRALFQDIADGIRGLADSLLKGLKGLFPKDKGSLGKALAFGAGAIATALLKPLKDLRNTFKSLGGKLKKTKIGGAFSNLLDKFKNFFKDLGDKFKKSKLGTFLKNNKVIIALGAFFKKLFGGGAGKSGFFNSLSTIFKKIAEFAKSGPFKGILNAVKGIGRLLGKLFLPLTVILGVVDFVKGFMKGYSEGGIIEGIKQGIQELFDGLVGGILRILVWIPKQIAKLFGLNKLSKALGEYVETLIKSIKDIFGGLVDLVVSIFTLDGSGILKSLEDIWDGIVDLVLAPFVLMGEAIEDIFDIDLDDLIQPLKDGVDSIFQWFIDLGEKIKNIFSLENLKKLASSIGDTLKNLIPGMGNKKEDNPPENKNQEGKPNKNTGFIQPNRIDLDMGLDPTFRRGASDTRISSTNNNDNSATVINNNHFHGTSDNSILALQRAFS